MNRIKLLPLFLFFLVSQHLFAKINVGQFEIERGINISHTLSQIPNSVTHPHRDVYFTEKDIILIKYVGFDHIRMPIDEEQMWNEDGQKIDEAWTYLHQVIGWCQKHELRVIVDLHIIRSHYFNAASEGKDANKLFDDPASQEVFLDLWRDISGELKQYGNDFLAYELLNESVAPNHDDWNKLVDRAMKVLRGLEKDRVVVIGSNWFQSFSTLPYLRVPENDPNIIVSFHYYDPFLVTHYNTGWCFMREYQGALNYPGLPIPEKEMNSGKYSKGFVKAALEHNKHWDKDVIEASIVKAIKYAKSKNLPIYCGEWGCYVGTPRELRVKLYEDTISVFEKHSIARANWDYQGDFSIFDKDQKEKIDWEILNVIVGK